ncbi:sugar transferase [Aeoliella mucimassa]|uniref:Putative sugar transferase EpsL n=1 Tax=Aeoliella mucimassa TaxID=2527972 RepID=A0A518AK38_9BACT|nr:sugar transferase [Aeoliella mucimassa]QDU55056.1 putative sugar transferase EpsL [Aeoliella mucimassa]
MNTCTEATLEARIKVPNVSPERRGSASRVSQENLARRLARQGMSHTEAYRGARQFALESGVAGEAIAWDPSAELSEALHEVEISAYNVLKRTMDIVIASVALLLLSPVMLVTALIIKLTDGGSIFYGHKRVGYRGREFWCLKFRSMIEDADKLKAKLLEESHHDDTRTFKIAKDPRLTTIGGLIRKLSIDELPQLFNVLRGEMSLVGPRPAVPQEVAQYTYDDLRRLEVKPGITCIWQVSGRSDLPFPEQLRLDIEYIENRTIWMDVTLLAKTVPAVLSTRGAY